MVGGKEGIQGRGEGRDLGWGSGKGDKGRGGKGGVREGGGEDKPGSFSSFFIIVTEEWLPRRCLIHLV